MEERWHELGRIGDVVQHSCDGRDGGYYFVHLVFHEPHRTEPNYEEEVSFGDIFSLLGRICGNYLRNGGQWLYGSGSAAFHGLDDGGGRIRPV